VYLLLLFNDDYRTILSASLFKPFRTLSFSSLDMLQYTCCTLGWCRWELCPRQRSIRVLNILAWPCHPAELRVWRWFVRWSHYRTRRSSL